MVTNVPEWAVWSERILIVVWLASAAVTWVFMHRNGHDGQLWALIGLVGGPFALLAAWECARRAARRPPEIVFLGSPGHGSRDVALVVDLADPATAGQAIGTVPDVRRAVLVAAIGPDTIDHAAHRGELRNAATALADAARVARRRGVDPAGVILAGHSTRAVISYAAADKLELLEGSRLPANGPDACADPPPPVPSGFFAPRQFCPSIPPSLTCGPRAGSS